MHVALDARVWTNRQQQTQTMAQHWDRLQAAIATQAEWHRADEPLDREAGERGASLNRPGLERLRDHVPLAAFERVLMPSPARRARTYIHHVLRLAALAKVGGEVVLLARPLSDTPHDHLLRPLRGAVAEDERRLMAERMRRGRPARLRSGPLLPWTMPPYGAILDPAHPRDPRRGRVDPSQAAVGAQSVAWYTAPQTPATLDGVAHQLPAAGLPPPPRDAPLEPRDDPRHSAHLPRAHPHRPGTPPSIAAAPGRAKPPSPARSSRWLEPDDRAGHCQPGHLRGSPSTPGSQDAVGPPPSDELCRLAACPGAWRPMSAGLFWAPRS